MDQSWSSLESRSRRSVLFRLFGASEKGAVSRGRPGRPNEYDWEALYIEIAVRADLDGLPLKQSQLVDDMLQWCVDTLGKEPSESRLKEKIALIYKHPKKAGK
jgi:hypothetical protein